MKKLFVRILIVLISITACKSKEMDKSISLSEEEKNANLFNSNECGCKSFLIGDDGLVLNVKDPFNLGFEEFNDLLAENEYFLGLYDLNDQKTKNSLHEILKKTISSPQYLSQLRNTSKTGIISRLFKNKITKNKSKIINIASEAGFNALLSGFEKRVEIDENLIEIARKSFDLNPSAFIQNYTENLRAFMEEGAKHDNVFAGALNLQNMPSNGDLRLIIDKYFKDEKEKKQNPTEVFVQNGIDFTLSTLLGNSLLSEIFDEAYRTDQKEFARALMDNSLGLLSKEVDSDAVEAVFNVISKDFLNQKIEVDSLLLESGFNFLIPKVISNEMIADVLGDSFSTDPKAFLSSASSLALEKLVEKKKISAELGGLINAALKSDPKSFVKELFPHGAKYLASVIYNSLKSDKVKEGISGLYDNDVYKFFAENNFDVSKDALLERTKEAAFKYAVQKIVHAEMVSNIFKNVFKVDPKIVSSILHVSFDLDPKKFGVNVLNYSGKQLLDSVIQKHFTTFSPLDAKKLGLSILKSPKEAFKSLLGPEMVSALAVSATILYVKFLVKKAISLMKEKNCLYEATSSRGDIAFMCTVSWNQKEKMKSYGKSRCDAGPLAATRISHLLNAYERKSGGSAKDWKEDNMQLSEYEYSCRDDILRKVVNRVPVDPIPPTEDCDFRNTGSDANCNEK